MNFIEGEYPKQRVNPGQKVFFTIPHLRIVIPAVVICTEDIFAGEYGTIWLNRFEDSSRDYATVPIAEKDSLGYPIWENKSPEVINGLKSENQFCMIDEPTGHSIQMGDEIFLSLHEALSHVVPSRKKRLRARLRAFRKTHNDFTFKTHGIKNDIPTSWEYPEKKIYVHKP